MTAFHVPRELIERSYDFAELRASAHGTLHHSEDQLLAWSERLGQNSFARRTVSIYEDMSLRLGLSEAQLNLFNLHPYDVSFAQAFRKRAAASRLARLDDNALRSHVMGLATVVSEVVPLCLAVLEQYLALVDQFGNRALGGYEFPDEVDE